MEKKIPVKEGSKIVGIVRLKQYRAGTFDRAFPVIERIKKLEAFAVEFPHKYAGDVARRLTILRDELAKVMEGGYIGLALEQKNLVMQGNLTGKDLLIQYLMGNMATGGTHATLNGGINYGALGTGSATPLITDTQLGAETNRTTVTYSQDLGYNEALIQFFFPDSVLANATYNEGGTFVNGTASANTGALFNHVLFTSPYVKTSGVDTTFEVDITLT